MNWTLTTQIPNNCVVAVSGGADSMALLHFVAQERRRSVTAAVYDHGTGAHTSAFPLVEQLCDRLGINVVTAQLSEDRARGQSREDHWRQQRYSWLRSLGVPVLTAHNLDDVAETWLWSSLHGQPTLMPAENQGVLRPLLAVRHAELAKYCEAHAIEYWLDPANTDHEQFARPRVRYVLKPAAEYVHPGFFTVIRRKLLTRRSLEHILNN
jgi:tRNA(Ile)-lysidine synthetase-like protein